MSRCANEHQTMGDLDIDWSKDGISAAFSRAKEPSQLAT